MDEFQDISYSKEYITMSQLIFALKHVRNYKILDSYIETYTREIGVNYVIPINSPIRLYKPHLLGCTILHIVLQEDIDVKLIYIIKLLSKNNADVTIKNYYGYTPLRQSIEVVEFKTETKKRCLDLKGKLHASLVDEFLEAQVNQKNFTNPICNNGISHLHIGCIVNHVNLVEFFLKSGVNPNDKIFMDSPHLAGFGPLHIAARYSNPVILELLLNYGADISSTNALKMTPLQLLIDRNKEIIDALNENLNLHKEFQTEFNTNVQMMDMIVASTKNDNLNFIDEIGLTYLHVICTKQKTTLEELTKHIGNINSPINLDSDFLPGYTPLHLAAHFSFESVKLLLTLGADVLSKDKNGVTPLDLCVERYKVKDIAIIISSQEKLKDISLSDGSKLTDLLLAMGSKKSLEDKNLFVSLDSPIVPGFTLYHLATIFEKKDEHFKKVSKLYKNVLYKHRIKYSRHAIHVNESILSLVSSTSNDIITPNADGMTPIHLALRLKKYDIIKSSLSRKMAVNVTDKDDLSHFHIACAANKLTLVEDFLKNGTKVDWPIKTSFIWKDQKTSQETYIPPGSTPLHISVACNRKHITEALLKNGAKPYVKDSEGLSCVHVAFIKSYDKNLIATLLQAPDMDNFNTETTEGLSHLHIACYTNNLERVKAIVRAGADVNKSVANVLKNTYAENPEATKHADYYTSTYDCSDSFVFLSPYSGFTPLHFAAKGESVQVIQFLIQNGADVYAKNSIGLTPLHILLNSQTKTSIKCVNYYLTVLKGGECIDDTGLTELHVACWSSDENKIKNLIDSGANVNSQISLDSPIWPGCTPLHIVISNEESHMVVDNESSNPIENTIRLLISSSADVTIKNAENKTPLQATNSAEFTNLMLSSPTIISANPIDSEGFSHFHIACAAGNADIIQELIARGADVNSRKDFLAYQGWHFSDAGNTPLHFAIHNQSNSEKIIKILLDSGADVNAENVYASSPLFYMIQNIHKDIHSEDLIKSICKILSTGHTDLNKKNVFGYTPIHWLFEVHDINWNPKTLKILGELGVKINLVCPYTNRWMPSLFFEKRALHSFSECMENATDLTDINEDGLNSIHHIVSYLETSDSFFSSSSNRIVTKYVIIIEYLIKKGCELDLQDKRGNTPLHLAVINGNGQAIEALLLLGSDINILNSNKKTAYSYNDSSSDGGASRIDYSLYMHIFKLLYYNLEVCQQNRNIYASQRSSLKDNIWMRVLMDEVESIKNKHIDDNETIPISYLLSESIVSMYYKMPQEKQAQIDLFFSSDRVANFPSLEGVFRLQYRKALSRKKLIEPAKHTLMLISGLPDLCCYMVLNYLYNSELKTLANLTKEQSYISHCCKRIKLN